MLTAYVDAPLVEGQLRLHQPREAHPGCGYLHGTAELSARRCNNPDRGDEAQLELSIYETRPNGSKGTRQVSMHASMILPPAVARELALAVCPELKTPDGMRNQLVAMLSRIAAAEADHVGARRGWYSDLVELLETLKGC